MVLSWLLSLKSPTLEASQEASPVVASDDCHSSELEGSADDETERLQVEEIRAKRLRMIGLFNNEQCTEGDFEQDNLQNTAEVFFNRGVQARARGDDASALECFRISAVAGSADSMRELARYYLAGTVCSKDVITAQALIREASRQTFVDIALMQNCTKEVAEMADAKLSKTAVPTVIELLTILTSKSSDAERIGAGRMLYQQERKDDPAGYHNPLWLSRLLGCENEIMQEAVADAIRVLAEKDEIDPEHPGGLLAIDKLVCLLTSARARVAAKGSAAAALTRLVYDVKTRDRILAVPQFVDNLKMLLWTGDEELQDAAAGALMTLAQGSKSGPHVLDAIVADYKAGHLAELVNFLYSNSGNLQDLGTSALASLALDRETGKAIAAVPGSLKALVYFLDLYTWHSKEQATRALANLALEPSTSRAIARTPGAIARLVRLLTRNTVPTTRMRAARALVNLTCKAENRKRVGNARRAFKALARLLSCKSAVLQRFGAWALGNLAHGPTLKARIVAEPGCLQGLVGLLGGRDARVQERAARALANLSISAASKKAVAAVPGALEGLGRLEGSSNGKVRGQAKRAIKNLGSGGGKCEDGNGLSEAALKVVVNVQD